MIILNSGFTGIGYKGNEIEVLFEWRHHITRIWVSIFHAKAIELRIICTMNGMNPFEEIINLFEERYVDGL